MELKYHRTTFRLLQCEPVVSKRAVRELGSLERALGVPLPASVREWYSFEGAVERLTLPEEEFGFDPFSISQNAKGLKRASARTQYHWTVAAFPATGVYFATSFPGDPDPIVHWRETDHSLVDHGSEFSERPFSAFVFACCWHNLQERSATISGVEPAFNPPLLDMLSELFDTGPHVMRGDAPQEMPHPFKPGERLALTRFQLFFFGPDGMIHLSSRENPTISTTEVRWALSATDEPAVQALAAQLKHRGIIS